MFNYVCHFHHLVTRRRLDAGIVFDVGETPKRGERLGLKRELGKYDRGRIWVAYMRAYSNLLPVEAAPRLPA